MKRSLAFYLLLSLLGFGLGSCANVNSTVDPGGYNASGHNTSGHNTSGHNTGAYPSSFAQTPTVAPTARVSTRTQRSAETPAPQPITFVYPRSQVLDADYLQRSSGTAEADLLAEVNRIRNQQGLNSLSSNAQLNRAAADYARVLAAQGRIDHTGPDGSAPAQRAERAGYIWGFIGENLAAGQSSPKQTVRDWMNSPAHRDNMLDRKPIEAGVGFAKAADDVTTDASGNRTIRAGSYWVLLVGKPRGA